jgi:hypothetical protein
MNSSKAVLWIPIRIRSENADPDVLGPNTCKKYIFLVKIHFLCRKSLTRIRIRMDPHWFGSLDPDPGPH